MLDSKKCAEVWGFICETFKNKKEKETPKETMDKILAEYDYNTVVEVFATVSSFKKHDGRIYGKNRDWMDSIAVNPLSAERDHCNPMFSGKLDYIHTTHINQLITELRNRK